MIEITDMTKTTMNNKKFIPYYDSYLTPGPASTAPGHSGYPYVPKPLTWKTSDGRVIEKPSFLKFFSHDELVEIKEAAIVRRCWGFQDALGETLPQKYYSLEWFLQGIRSDLVRNGAAGLFWIAASPEVCALLEHGSMTNSPYGYEQRDYGINTVECVGILERRWRLYRDDKLTPHSLLISVNDKRQDDKHAAYVTVINW